MRKRAIKNSKATSIDVLFDLSTPGVIDRMEEFVAGFGEGYTEVEFVSDEAAIVRVFPDGGKEPKN